MVGAGRAHRAQRLAPAIDFSGRLAARGSRYGALAKSLLDIGLGASGHTTDDDPPAGRRLSFCLLRDNLGIPRRSPGGHRDRRPAHFHADLEYVFTCESHRSVPLSSITVFGVAEYLRLKRTTIYRLARLKSPKFR